ncbi:MAG: hypothetical protein KDF65_03295 [Anaerolineae bacterium]|nr:hypothetical protein [Anaerolineae bacterium]
MKLHHIISYSLLVTGAVASVKALFERWQWEENNVLASILLDWDDVQAVATRAGVEVEALLAEYAAGGATYLSIPEVTLARLLAKGELSVTQGATAGKVYLRAQDAAVAEWVTTELAARLPQLAVSCPVAKNPLISFSGDLPAVAEVGLGFHPAQAELARRAGLAPLPRPVAFGWMQPAMIERSLAQAAAVGAKMVAVQGWLMPGHEFNMPTTIDTLKQLNLKIAYFSESRHQRGDWHLVKNLTEAGLVVLAHEFEPAELLEEDWNTVSDRWGHLATEAGIRLCSVRFFRMIHAGDPLESVVYVRTLSQALQRVGLVPGQVGAINLTAFQPRQEALTLAGLGLGSAGALGLASDLLPLPDRLKLAGVSLAALGLSSLPFLEQLKAGNDDGHHHHHDDHDHGHHHHADHDHHHDHEHGHSHGPAPATAYASKGIALAAAVAYPAAALAVDGDSPLGALARSLALSASGAATLGASVADIDYALNIEPYRGYHLDWLLPLGLAAASSLVPTPQKNEPLSLPQRLLHRLNPKSPTQNPKSKIQNPQSPWRWLPLAGVALAALTSFKAGDPLAGLDREHRHSHTHHLSAFQRLLGDSKMALNAKPLRKWALLAPLGAVGAVLLKRHGRTDLAGAALTAAAAGQVATLSGFRNGQRPLLTTLEGRAKGWAVGAGLALVIWLVTALLGRNRR